MRVAKGKKGRTHARGTHPTHSSPCNELERVLRHTAEQEPRLKNNDGEHKDPLGGEDAHNLAIEKEENCLGKNKGGGNPSLEGKCTEVLAYNTDFS